MRTTAIRYTGDSKQSTARLQGCSSMTSKKLPLADDVAHHARWFVACFVSAPHRSRWEHILIEKPEKSKTELHRLEHHLDSRQCIAASLDDLRHPTRGSRPGVLFRSGTVSDFPSLAEAIDNLGSFQPDAFFCDLNHTFAVLFHHDGHVWLCQ